ncbi:hypothetical protein AVEN_225042-1 [Araneus ventricosus]|uniref:Uncharacterized protein n=1 Tax=Araneus ventricosus TaxID=182803 RepID=A0A4Y2IT32_ARAVE|nr:hypothetical protein AVEN_225042-1 [Araneus ventricosus]
MAGLWFTGTHTNSNPVPSRRSIACFRHRSSDAFLQCLQCCWHWGYINFVLLITPQEEITWRQIWLPEGPWQQRSIIQTSTPYPAMCALPPSCTVPLQACHLASTRATRRAFKLGERMYLVTYHPSL